MLDVAAVQFFFDPMCPWAYRSSIWIREVRRQTELDISWRFFSLEEVNREERKKHPWERRWSFGWSQLRIAARLRRDSNELVDRWYETCGAAFFERGEPTFTPEGAATILETIGLPGSLVDEAIDDPSRADEVRAEHEWLVDTYGGHGVPTLVFEDVPGSGTGDAFFGPVVLTPPTGATALRLWDLVNGWREYPDLYELRRPKTRSDLTAIAGEFATYVQARRWNTVQRPAV